MRTERFVYASSGAQHVFGRSPEELCALDAPKASEFLSEFDGEEAEDATFGRAIRVRHKDGTVKWLQTKEVVLKTDSMGQVTQMLGVCQDVTAGRTIKRDHGLHKHLIRSLNRIVRSFSVLPAAEDITDSVNDGLRRLGPILGATRCHLCRFHGQELLPIRATMTHEYWAPGLAPLHEAFSHLPTNLFPSFFERINDRSAVFLGTGEQLPDSDSLLRKLLSQAGATNYLALPLVDGAKCWGYFGLVAEDEDSKVWDADVVELLRLVGQVFVNRISYADSVRERITAEMRWRRTADSSFDLILILDMNSRVIDVTSHIEELDVTRFLGEHVSVVTKGPSFRRLKNTISQVIAEEDFDGSPRDVEIEAIGPDGDIVWYRARVSLRVKAGKIEGVNLFATIIHEQKEAAQRVTELNREFEQASRLSILGQMATEIAHELNQPLQVIASYSEGLCMRLKTLGHEELADVTGQIVQASADAAQTVRSVREFVSNRRVVEVESVEISDIVSGTMALADSIIRENGVLVETNVPDDLPAVRVNPAQFNHVLLNLIVNGIEAAMERVSHEIQIRIDCLYHEAEKEVAITVSDNGPGVPPAKREAIFRRYVTTKRTGLGVGLASSRDVVQRYGGQLSLLEDNPDEPGARFRFTIPLAAECNAIDSQTPLV
jgi:signal transduction histidine kinase